jgi:hypothetical protein
MDKPRFEVGKNGDHLVIRDEGRPVIAFLPNSEKPHSPRFMAEICTKALNAENDKYENKNQSAPRR